ncbi:MAG TPA: FAD-dependent oxidoreductase [Longimicrobium sp.]|nr:FAD-dependent oxidoreductase [Longimicrobium sp.]
MGAGEAELTGPDLEQGMPLGDVGDGELLLGHAGGEPVLLVRRGDELFAVGASCAHYGVSLADGLLVGHEIRCPAHHAAFDLRTGDVLRAPALNPIPCWEVEVRDGTVRVTGKRAERPKPRASYAGTQPERIVIAGAGAAGSAAAQALRREGFTGSITLVGADMAPPYDRPNLSKDYLAGNAPEEWMPLFPEDFYRENGIDLLLGSRVAKLEPQRRVLQLLNGRELPYDGLLLATGSDPIRLPVATHGLDHVLYLRSMADARAIIARLPQARRAVVVGASFIGLEAAAALRERGVEVDIVSDSEEPLAHVLGPGLGAVFRRVHQEHGVTFHLRDTVAAVGREQVTLRSGRTLPADLVVVGIGVRPGVGLASWAGLALDRGGVAVDEQLQTSAPGVYAAGDLCAWPDPRTGRRIRSEHWVVAQRQGQTAARNLMGAGERFDAVPFFWTQSYDLTLRYVGHAEKPERVQIDGSLDGRDATAVFWEGGRPLAVATVGRDRVALQAEAEMERQDWRALERMLGGAVQHA